MVALITGQSGFIGQHLTKALEAQGIEVVGFPRWMFGDYFAMQDFFKKNKPDYIYHLAAYGNMSNQKDDRNIFDANVLNTFNLLICTKDIPYKAFIHFGSSSEYGKKLRPMREEDILEPETMYAATKAAGTMLSRAFCKQYDKPIITVRPFSVYGEGEADFRLIPTVIHKALFNEELSLDPTAVHDWIHIDDFISGVIQVVEHAEILKGIAVNIGTGKQSTNAEIVSLIGEILDRPIKTISNYNDRPTDSTTWVGNINTLKLLKWRQQVTLREGLARTCEYYVKKYYAE